MPVDVWVENHQPVPLVPLRELGLRRGSIVFIGTRVVIRRDWAAVCATSFTAVSA